MGRPLFQQVAIVGLGLIGGSLGMALRQGRIARRVIGFARREATIRQAIRKGAIDDGDTELCPDWLGQSDLVVIATPPLSVVPIARRIARMISHPLILTDVASTKAEIVRALDRGLPLRIAFVGAHPIAGSERSGIEAAESGLFRGAACLLTPTARTDRRAMARVAALWRRVGCRVQKMSPGRHDALVAQVSHLPHLAAVGLTLTPRPQALRLAGSGFADATRIAAGNPDLWEEIFRTNAGAVTGALDRFIRRMQEIRRLSRPGRSAALRRRLRSARRRRLSIGR